MDITYQNSKGEFLNRSATADEEAAIIQLCIMPIGRWSYPERTIRINLSDEQWIALSIDYPEFGVIRKQKNIPVEPNGIGGEFLYLEELRDEDRQLFLYFGGLIENKPL